MPGPAWAAIVTPSSHWRSIEEGWDDPKPISESLDRVAQGLGAPPATALRAVFNQWATVVGDDLAQHSRPLSLVGGTLVVAVDHPAWATSLRYVGDALLARLDEKAGPGVVTRVDVRVRPAVTAADRSAAQARDPERPSGR